MQRSTDEGRTWDEVTAPAYPEGAEIKEGVPAATRYLWAMQHGGQSNPTTTCGSVPNPEDFSRVRTRATPSN